jgi:hypothetical protein
MGAGRLAPIPLCPAALRGRVRSARCANDSSTHSCGWGEGFRNPSQAACTRSRNSSGSNHLLGAYPAPSRRNAEPGAGVSGKKSSGTSKNLAAANSLHWVDSSRKFVCFLHTPRKTFAVWWCTTGLRILSTPTNVAKVFCFSPGTLVAGSCQRSRTRCWVSTLNRYAFA